MDFEVGNIVIVHKPDDLDEPPYWVDDMDKYDGVVGEITEIEVDDYEDEINVYIKGCGNYRYSPNWLEFYEDTSEDLGDIYTNISVLL